MRAGASERGMIMVTVLLLLLGCTLIAHAAFILARSEREVATVHRRLLRAELAAEAGLQRAYELLADTLEPPWLSERVVWDEGSSFRLRLDTVGPEVRLVRSAGRHGEPGAVVQLGWLLWRMDPVQRVVEAAAVAAAPSISGTVTAGGWWAPDDADVAACSEMRIEAARRGAAAPAPTATREDSVLLGRLSPSRIAQAADIRVAGVQIPRPLAPGGRCAVEDPSNWGDPSPAVGPCSDYRPIVASVDDLEVRGGVGQGVLLVTGDLVLSSGARFRGVILVGGRLTLREGARVEGWVRAGAAIQTEDSASVSGSGCALGLALGARPALRAPLPLEARRRPILP